MFWWAIIDKNLITGNLSAIKKQVKFNMENYLIQGYWCRLLLIFAVSSRSTYFLDDFQVKAETGSEFEGLDAELLDQCDNLIFYQEINS